MAPNHDISLYSNLRDRDLRREGILIAEGRHLVDRLLASGLEIYSLLCSERMAEEYRDRARGICPLHVLADGEMAALAGFPFHRGVMAAAARPVIVPLERFLSENAACRNLAVCPRLSRDENLGSIIRASAALGADAVVIGPRSCDPFSRRALKASMGAALSLPVVAMDEGEPSLAPLKRRGITVYGASTGGASIPLHAARPSERRAAVFGNEEDGLPEDIASQCDEIVHVPMHHDTDSLNVAVAAGIILHALFSEQ